MKPPSGTLTVDELRVIIEVIRERLDTEAPNILSGIVDPRTRKLLRSAKDKLSALARPVKKREFDPQTARCKCGQALSGHSRIFPHPCNGHGSIDDPDYLESCDCERFVPA